MFDILTNIGIIAGAIIGLGVIWTKGALPLYRFLRKMEQVHDIILEFPEWKAHVDLGLKQLSPNGGNSLHDKITVNTACVEHLSEDVTILKEMVEAHLSDTGAHRIYPG